MRPSPRLGAAIVTLLLATGACSSDDTTAATTSTTTTEATTTTESTTTTTDPAATADEPSGYTVVLEDPGAEPRRELRLRAEVGDVDRVTQRQEMSLEIRSGDQVQSSPSPVTEIDLAYTVDEVDDDRITALGAYEDVRVLDTPGTDPAIAEQMRELLGGFRGATARTTYTTTGAVLSAELEDLDLPGTAGPMVEQVAGSLTESVESLSMPFPDEAVGSGARWRIDTEATIAGLPVEITTTVTLTELDDERAGGTVEQSLRFVPGDVDILGVAATVISGELRGSGAIEWDLARGLVPRSDITTAGTTVIEANGVRIEQSQRQRISFTAR